MTCDDEWCWTILDANNMVWAHSQTAIMSAFISNCDEYATPSSIRKRRRQVTRRRKTKCAEELTNPVEKDENSDDAAMESTEPEDMIRNEFSSDAEFEKAEREATARIQIRKERSEQSEKTTDDVVAQELTNIADSILECEEYELATTGKSSWTLKKIGHQIRELKHILFVDCHITIPINLLHVFAERVFVGKRKHLRHAFLFRFTTR